MLPVKDYEGWYEVDKDGVIYSVCRKNKIKRKPYKVKGYLRVRLQKEGKSKNMLVHRIVAETYIPNPDNLPQVNHKDKNTSNNSVENLEWVTEQQNVEHAIGKLIKFIGPEEQIKECTASVLAREFKLSRGNIGEVCNRKRKQCKGWRLYEPS